jgi:hypothetical protein
MELTVELRVKKTDEHIMSLNVYNKQYYITTPYYSGHMDEFIYPTGKSYDFNTILKEHHHLREMLIQAGNRKLTATMFLYQSVDIPKSIRRKLLEV